MYWFRIEQTLQPTEREPAAGECFSSQIPRFGEKIAND